MSFILAGIGAATSLIGDAFDRAEAAKNQNRAVQAMKELIIPRAETERRADRYGDNFYTKSMGELNAGAFAYRGALNPETLRTMAFGDITAGRANAEMQVEEADFGFNQNIKAQIAQIKAQPLPSVNPMNAVEAGVGGYFAGRQLDMSEDLMARQGAFFDARTADLNRSGKRNTAKAATYVGAGYTGIGGGGAYKGYAGNIDYFNLKNKKVPNFLPQIRPF